MGSTERERLLEGFDQLMVTNVMDAGRNKVHQPILNGSSAVQQGWGMRHVNPGKGVIHIAFNLRDKLALGLLLGGRLGSQRKI